MLGLDTTSSVRLLIEDDAAQTRRARKLVDTAIAEEETVLFHFRVARDGMVLRSRYEVPPETILGLFRAALRSAGTSVRGRGCSGGGTFQLAG